MEGVQSNSAPETHEITHDHLDDGSNQKKVHCNQSSSTTEPITQESQLLLTAADYKSAGNKLCSLHRYDEAIAYYSKAILKNPTVSIYYSNRALCHLRLQQWSQAVEDCHYALELDPILIKAHFFLGQALAELEQYDDALRHLQRAHELARDRQMNFGDDITYQIRLVKRLRWNKMEEDAAQSERDLHDYLSDLIKKDQERRLQELDHRLLAIRGESTDDSSLWQQATSSSSIRAGSSNEEDQLELERSKIISKCDSFNDKLEKVFNTLRQQRMKRDVPDYLCGKISFEIMHDPVITPSGITYDRQDIEEHLKRVGHFDPITRQPLKSNHLISNLAMKEVVDSYLNENEWAKYY